MGELEELYKALKRAEYPQNPEYAEVMADRAAWEIKKTQSPIYAEAAFKAAIKRLLTE